MNIFWHQEGRDVAELLNALEYWSVKILYILYADLFQFKCTSGVNLLHWLLPIHNFISLEKKFPRKMKPEELYKSCLFYIKFVQSVETLTITTSIGK